MRGAFRRVDGASPSFAHTIAFSPSLLMLVPQPSRPDFVRKTCSFSCANSRDACCSSLWRTSLSPTASPFPLHSCRTLYEKLCDHPLCVSIEEPTGRETNLPALVLALSARVFTFSCSSETQRKMRMGLVSLSCGRAGNNFRYFFPFSSSLLSRFRVHRENGAACAQATFATVR